MKPSNMNAVTIEFTKDEILLLDKLTSIAIEADYDFHEEEELFMEMTKKISKLSFLVEDVSK